MDQARGLSVPTRGKVAFALAVVSAEGLRDDGVFLWLRDVGSVRISVSGEVIPGAAQRGCPLYLRCSMPDLMR